MTLQETLQLIDDLAAQRCVKALECMKRSYELTVTRGSVNEFDKKVLDKIDSCLLTLS